MNPARNQQGFTLIETLVYVAIISIIATVVISALLWIVRSDANAKARRATADSTRNAMRIMTREIREAKGLYTPTMTTPTQLSLETKTNLPSEETSTYVDFFLCGSKLCVKRELQNPVALTSEDVEVVSVVFTEVTTSSTPSIQITLQVEYQNPGNKPELEVTMNATTTISLRSY